jgi:hypothetical protein
MINISFLQKYLGKFSKQENRDRYVWWKFLCEKVLAIIAVTSVAVPFMMATFFVPNPDGLLFITSFFPESSNFWIVWGLSLPLNLLINMAAWAQTSLCVNLLAIFIFNTTFLVGELRFGIVK